MLCSTQRSFAFIGPALWNQLPPSTRSSLLTGRPSASFRSLKTTFFSVGLSHGSASDWCALREALHKFIDKYNTTYFPSYVYSHLFRSLIHSACEKFLNVLYKRPHKGIRVEI